MKTSALRALGITFGLGLAACVAAAPASRPAQPPPDPTPDSVLFPEIQAAARAIDQSVRQQLPIPGRDWFPKQDIRNFGRLVHTSAGPKLASANFANLEQQLQYLEVTLTSVNHELSKMPVFTVEHREKFGTFEGVRYTMDDDATQTDLSAAQAREKITVNGREIDRESALKSLEYAVSPYQLALGWKSADDVGKLLDPIAEDWDNYFEKGRPQQFLDVVASSFMHLRNRKSYLTPAPATQYFLLHPNFVYEELRSAPDGQQSRAAVAIEWVGINWWKAKIPFGISLASLYSDRSGATDFGHGACIYIANKYCIGWANHGGKHGFYFSLDAVKLIDSKKAKLEQYRSRAQSYFGRN